MRGHCSALEAAEMARAAGVGALCLTHYGEFSGSRDLDESARSLYGGDIIVADDHSVIPVGEKVPAA
jgi:ribonuclease BN (tRNA processing enzyme)